MKNWTWLDWIEYRRFDPWMEETMIADAQRTLFSGDLPAEFALLGGGFVDLGFGILGLPEPELNAVRRAFVGGGVSLAGTTYRLKNLRPGQSVVEPADGTELAILPNHWRRGVLVVKGDKYSWVGKASPAALLPGFVLGEYRDAGDGWVLADDVSVTPEREKAPPGPRQNA